MAASMEIVEKTLAAALTRTLGPRIAGPALTVNLDRGKLAPFESTQLVIPDSPPPGPSSLFFGLQEIAPPEAGFLSGLIGVLHLRLSGETGLNQIIPAEPGSIHCGGEGCAAGNVRLWHQALALTGWHGAALVAEYDRVHP
jgi:hypothetical protein